MYGRTEKFQTDPYWRDLILFFEYFHGDNGAGIGASHQTGWTGIVARLIQMFAVTTSGDILANDFTKVGVLKRSRSRSGEISQTRDRPMCLSTIEAADDDSDVLCSSCFLAGADLCAISWAQVPDSWSQLRFRLNPEPPVGSSWAVARPEVPS